MKGSACTMCGGAVTGLASTSVFSAYLPLALVGLVLVLVGQTKHRHSWRRGRY